MGEWGKLTDAGNVDAGGVQNGRDFGTFRERGKRGRADSITREEDDSINRRCFYSMADGSDKACGPADRFMVRLVDVVHVVTAQIG